MNHVPAIELRDVTVTYDRYTANEFTALHTLSLSVMKGESLVITGDNGSGKSTLLKALSGTVPVTSGRVLIEGVNVSSWPAYRRARLVAIVHQEPMLGTCPNLTIHENARLYNGKQWWWPFPDATLPKPLQSATVESLRIPLELKGAMPLKTLSGGQRQGAAIALALSSHRSILLMDEFSSSLDKRARAAWFHAIGREARVRKLTTLSVAHDLTGFEEFDARVVCLREGCIVES